MYLYKYDTSVLAIEEKKLCNIHDNASIDSRHSFEKLKCIQNKYKETHYEMLGAITHECFVLDTHQVATQVIISEQIMELRKWN